MGNRTHQFIPGGYYHIYNRGVEKRTVFQNDTDYDRFLKRLAFYQQIDPNLKFSRSGFAIPDREPPLHFDVIAYALMPNHFHLLIQVLDGGSVPTSLAALMNSYTKYFNIRYERVGSLFQGVYQSVDVRSDEQLIHLVRYILLNPFVAKLESAIGTYRWTSYAESIDKPTRFSICNTTLIRDYFPKSDDLRKFLTDYADLARELGRVKHLTLE